MIGTSTTMRGWRERKRGKMVLWKPRPIPTAVACQPSEMTEDQKRRQQQQAELLEQALKP